MRAARLAIALAAGISAAACSDSGEPSPSPPSLDERATVSEAEAMIPAEERVATSAPPSPATRTEGTPGGRQPKAPYRTPVPGPSPAQ